VAGRYSYIRGLPPCVCYGIATEHPEWAAPVGVAAFTCVVVYTHVTRCRVFRSSRVFRTSRRVVVSHVRHARVYVTC
jgi:hypothetical protein